MGNFYNETRVRTKIFVVTHVSLLVISAIIVNIVLTTEKFIGLGITGYMTIGIPALFLMGAAFEAIRCRIRYRYLIIADQLIIHRVKGARDEVKVDIKLKDIVFVGKVKDMHLNVDLSEADKFTCVLRNSNSYCCVYLHGDSYRSFYFQPSLELIRNIENLRNKYKLCSKGICNF